MCMKVFMAVALLCAFSVVADAAAIVAFDTKKQKVRIYLDSEGLLRGEWGHSSILAFEEGANTYMSFCYEGESEDMVPLLTAMVESANDPYGGIDMGNGAIAATVKYIHFNRDEEVKVGTKITQNGRSRVASAAFHPCARF